LETNLFLEGALNKSI